MLRLWTLARLTVVPSSSTGSKIATGLIRPVRDGLHSIWRKIVSRVSSCHLNAIESRGNFAVRPSDSAIGNVIVRHDQSIRRHIVMLNFLLKLSYACLRPALKSHDNTPQHQSPAHEATQTECSWRLSNSTPSARTSANA